MGDIETERMRDSIVLKVDKPVPTSLILELQCFFNGQNSGRLTINKGEDGEYKTEVTAFTKHR